MGVQNYVNCFFDIYKWLIIVYIFMSYLPNVRDSFIGKIISKVVEPYLAPFCRIIPPIGGVIDISPIAALFTLVLVNNGVIAILQYLSKLG